MKLILRRSLLIILILIIGFGIVKCYRTFLCKSVKLPPQSVVVDYVNITASPIIIPKEHKLILRFNLETYQNFDFFKLPIQEIVILKDQDSKPYEPYTFSQSVINSNLERGVLEYKFSPDIKKITLILFGTESEPETLQWSLPKL